ncbi:Flp family type IVb pilin [Pseudomonas gingeri NCPPB 3146 = LMG 5327]|uniref:Flp family type IVb pilin n=2 Tax=Pseudomonas gingeri TaxID=117681 RepID=A0A7Y7Y5G9_9PSED|nr:Flp family type IVb pilin [Pseudomonas gingeri]NVZ24916.1 Flp family type IVb pilin [Pseudomonas gingeri]NWA06448.1 Flp family type IVb pilin [Pseudomonas gingeri]NWC17976.1 Flp family type IVb pilin [Pseudomonas gingeri]NWE49723.1 Flp family type IVb pilin [Pseudomonas gingeri]NWE67503.1 Flp family type IVb pilin [Pseudomonas gingeri]
MFLELVIRLYVQVQVFFHRKEGASGIEYAIVAAMVAVVIAGLAGGIGDKIKTIFTNIQNGIGS